MEYHLALPPELGLTPEELVSAWNARPECQQVAQARLAPPTSATFDPTVLIAVLTVVVTVGTSVLSNLLTEVLKEKLLPHEHPHLRVTEQGMPDGSRVLVVETEGD